MLRTMALLALATGLSVEAAQAQDRYLGEIILTGYTFCPRGTAEANGALLPINQNSALFSLYGTTYGGDGRTTFALPDLRGRAPIHSGQGDGLPDRRLGDEGGANTITLTQNEMPRHTHSAKGTPTGTAAKGDKARPTGNVPARNADPKIYGDGSSQVKRMKGGSVRVSVAPAGQGHPVDITNPFLALRYCVVMQGIYPSRN